MRTGRPRTRTPEQKRAYQAFWAAKERCSDPSHPAWSRYGGRGIEFRFASFADFLADAGPCPQGLTLDRVDNDGHYEAGNVRWVTYREQAGNRRSTKRFVTIEGVTRLLREWSRVSGLSIATLNYRYAAKWPASEMLRPPRFRSDFAAKRAEGGGT